MPGAVDSDGGSAEIAGVPAVPVPDRGTFNVGALDWIVTNPSTAPLTVGAKATARLHDCDTFKLVGHGSV